MRLTRIDIYNLALGNIKIGKKVGSLDDETAREFQLPQNYDLALATLLAMHDWSFATVSRKLARVAAFSPEGEWWRHGWAYPTDAVKILRVGRAGADGRFDFSGDPSWDVMNGPVGKIVLTSHDLAAARYVSDAVPVPDWPPQFVAAFAWAMASAITRANNAADADADYRMKQAEYYFQRAVVADAQELDSVPARQGSWLSARRRER